MEGKNIIALIVGITFFAGAIFLNIKRKISDIFAISLLLISIIAGLSISNYDVIKRLKLKDFEIEIADLKNKAINEIEKEISVQKKSIQKLIADENSLKEQGIAEYINYDIFGHRPVGAVNGVPMGPLSPIDGWSIGFIVRHPEGKIEIKCSPSVIDKCEQVIRQVPLYPFSYYFLAKCLKEKGNQSWKDFAIEAKSILEKTTKFPKHHPDHDLILQEINKLI